MKVLVFEDNLMWSTRLRQTVSALGHEVELFGTIPEIVPAGDVAIVNLSSSRMGADLLVPSLKAAGLYVIGHAGHKEKELHKLGRELGCDCMASNSQLTFKLQDLLAEAGRAEG